MTADHDPHRTQWQTRDTDARAAVLTERRRVAHELHGGVVQQVTAVSLAIDNALLHDDAGRHDRSRVALETARRITDLLVSDCRRLLDELSHAEGP